MSRPTRTDAAATETITVRVTPAERRDLEDVALHNGTDLVGVIRDAVNTYVADFREDQPAFRISKPRPSAKLSLRA